MSKGRWLTSDEEAAIDALLREKFGVNAIAKNIRRSPKAVRNYIKRKKSGVERKRGGRPPILTATALRVVVNSAKKPGMTAAKVVAATGVRASVRTVQRALSAHEHMVFGHLKARPQLTPRHSALRYKRAKDMSWVGPSKWRRTIFTDEKRFCLDGPDGTACYWRDSRIPRASFSKRQKGGGGVMIWAGISWRGKTPLVFVTNKINAVE